MQRPGALGMELRVPPEPAIPAGKLARPVYVARPRGPNVTLEQIAADFGIHPMTLSKWLRAADVADGVKPGVRSDQLAELRELKRWNRLLEQENEVLRRAAAYLSGAAAGKGSTRS